MAFQFHKGTIKTYYDYKTNYDVVLFQFHKGTIKTFFVTYSSAKQQRISIP